MAEGAGCVVPQRRRGLGQLRWRIPSDGRRPHSAERDLAGGVSPARAERKWQKERDALFHGDGEGLAY